MKLLATSDLHCTNSHWTQLVQAVENLRPDVVTVAGDLFPKEDGLLGESNYLEGITESLVVLAKLAKVVIIPGNDDNTDLLPQLKKWEDDGLCQDVSSEPVALFGYEFVGCPWVKDHPFGYKGWVKPEFEDDQGIDQFQYGRPCEIKDDQFVYIEDYKEYLKKRSSLYDTLTKQAKAVNNILKSIWLIHGPPKGINLDVLLNGKCVGSQAVTCFIEEVQPMLTLHGHIHESPAVTDCWFNKINKTICINPGQRESQLQYVLLDIVDGKVIGNHSHLQERLE